MLKQLFIAELEDFVGAKVRSVEETLFDEISQTPILLEISLSDRRVLVLIIESSIRHVSIYDK